MTTSFRSRPSVVRWLRRAVVRLTGGTAALASIALGADQAVLPNILWITSEDNGPHLGAYGDDYAVTPHLDGLARKGMIYLNAWSTAPVCAPARTTLISGIYPTATGAQHMRSMTRLPEGMRMYPQFLRELGYYCTNNSKEDYNLAKPGKVWDDSSGRAHWRNRASGQPFFAIFNHTVSHESQVRKRPHELQHDPAKAPIPAYHPDTPETRRDWAQYYDKITEMDERAGRNLRELEEAGLADDTIVFYYGDHGAGMPRSKRWPYNSGLHVPLIVFVPEKFKRLAPEDYSPGGRSERLVGFIDLAPTTLSLVGIRPPDWMQGHAFMGEYEAAPQPFLFGFRGRMDERIDMVRSVRDQRFIYIRNYMPNRIYGQFVSYMFQTPTTQVWKDLYDAGKLRPPQTYFWEVKPAEELYDLKEDPDEVRNLVDSPEHREALNRLRWAHRTHALAIRDLGFLPEAEIHSRAQSGAPYEMGRDGERYPMEKIMGAAELASSLAPDVTDALRARLGDEDSAVRYWGAMGILMRGEDAVSSSRGELRQALTDPAYPVRIAAAEALGKYGDERDQRDAVATLMDAAHIERSGVYAATSALLAIDELDEKASGRLEEIRHLSTDADEFPARARGYPARLIDKIVDDLE